MVNGLGSDRPLDERYAAELFLEDVNEVIEEHGFGIAWDPDEGHLCTYYIGSGPDDPDGDMIPIRGTYREPGDERGKLEVGTPHEVHGDG